MTENDFIVAIQAVLTEALDAGWPLQKIVDKAMDAVNEFEEENPAGDEEEDKDE